MKTGNQTLRQLAKEYRDTLHVMAMFYDQYPERFSDTLASEKFHRRFEQATALAELFANVLAAVRQIRRHEKGSHLN